MTMMQQGAHNDNQHKVREQLDQLLRAIGEAAQAGTALHQVERSIFTTLLTMGHALLVYFFEQLGQGDQGPQVELADGKVLKRLEGLRERGYQSVFGEFRLSRWVYAVREGQRQDYVPLDARLQLPDSAFSYVLQDWAQALAMDFPFAQVGNVLEKMLGIKLCVSAAERMNRAMAESVEAYVLQTPAQPAEVGEFIVVSADGKGVPMRKPAASPAIQAHDGQRGPKADVKKMAIVGAVYDGQVHVRTPEAVLASLFHLPGQAANDDRDSRPKPIAKTVRALLTHTVDGAEINARSVIFPWLGEQVRQRDPEGNKAVVVLMDGQHCLWTDAHAQLDNRFEILDLLHATSKLWDVAHVLDEHDKQLDNMMFYTKLLLQGRVLDLVTLFRYWASEKQMAPAAEKKVETVCGYFEAHQERMRYHEYLAAGYPIASGVIEGACRHVVKDRMERSGMHWTVEGAQAMLKLRCVAINEQWDEFTQFRIARESERLYPHSQLYEVENWPMAMAA